MFSRVNIPKALLGYIGEVLRILTADLATFFLGAAMPFNYGLVPGNPGDFFRVPPGYDKYPCLDAIIHTHGYSGGESTKTYSDYSYLLFIKLRSAACPIYYLAKFYY